ncbi:hypothetical protein TNCV_3751441 [Trichonephila clavipes]|nr:hypothetical protein TNCV_3751441 [Trichonephila clavipes]
MAYYYGNTHQNVINSSSMDWKPLRGFLGLVRSATRLRLIRQPQLYAGRSIAAVLMPLGIKAYGGIPKFSFVQ